MRRMYKWIKSAMCRENWRKPAGASEFIRNFAGNNILDSITTHRQMMRDQTDFNSDLGNGPALMWRWCILLFVDVHTVDACFVYFHRTMS